MSDAGAPKWSIVIATRGRPDQLRGALRACAVTAAESDGEIVVVDDDPAGSAETVVGEARATRPIAYLRCAGRGPGAARNIGARAARGELLAFTDDDCEPRPGWLAQLEAAIDGDARAAAAGTTVNAAPRLCSEASQIVIDALRDSLRTRGGPAFVTSNNVAMIRDSFLGLGGFDERFRTAAAEDRNFCERWLEAGNRFADAPEAVVMHLHSLRLAGFWRQHFRYGKGAHTLHRLRRGRGGHRMRLQSQLYPALARTVRSREEPLPRRLGLGALIVVSQLANAGGYASAGLEAGIRRSPA